MPLDTASFAEAGAVSIPPTPRRPRPQLDVRVPVGAAMQALRESIGLGLDDIAEATRVRVARLAAIEAGAIDRLPSRPFTIGYVRAYAKSLGLDADATAARFRTEYPSPDDELHNPVGVAHQRQRRNGAFVALAAIAAVAVIGWNLARHVTGPAAHPAAVARMAAPVHPPAAVGPFHAYAPLPAPPEATAPAPYVTPGLAGAAAGSANAADAALTAAPTNAVAKPAADPNAPPTPFVAEGAIYGPVQGTSGLIIQARNPIAVEVRGPGGVVYFARELAAGEAYRVPDLPGLTAEVSNPDSAELFDHGVSRGLFAQTQIALKSSDPKPSDAASAHKTAG